TSGYRRSARRTTFRHEETTAVRECRRSVQVEDHAQGARRGTSASPGRASQSCLQRFGVDACRHDPTPFIQPHIRRAACAARASCTARMCAASPRDSSMANKMLIDATHPEETRVVVLRGNRVEEFDFESASKRPLRGNIYLAKVTRVEPSLQAAFVEYGGSRYGFLAFSEIHPDYYQIPGADRQALLEEEALSQREDDDEANSERRSRRRRHPRRAEVE